MYAPGRRDLTPEEVEQEIAKGNIVRVGDFKRMLQDAYSWEKEEAADMLLAHILKERCAPLPGPCCACGLCLYIIWLCCHPATAWPTSCCGTTLSCLVPHGLLPHLTSSAH